MNDLITAQEWFSSGTRVLYDPVMKKVVERAEKTDIEGEIRVWKRVERDAARNNQGSWTTFLPGFPDGSFGWAQVDRQLRGNGMLPKIHVEFIGQAESDKPRHPRHPTQCRSLRRVRH